MKALIFLAAFWLASCAQFNPSGDQIRATTSLVRVVVDLASGK